ncbi:Thiol-disulfide oxidoreductase ResA [Paraconexibacter sp. AEG42_29]|uniref:Thiol-disulfide oxidoreductase ResA n=1 Tax=Paraconexibacter sp. AEG42_29 TaxID=2997339 RepID=A0AAU7ASW1_9ACTN
MSPDGPDTPPPEDDGPLGFGGDATPKDRYAHRRDPDLAAYGIGPDASGDRPPPARLPVGTSRYTWFVGVVAVLVIAYVSVNSITTKGPGSRGIVVGITAPPFAAPLATGDLDGDVNVAREAEQEDAGRVPACSIHREGVLNICDLYAEKPVVLAFFATRGDPCSKQLDTIERIARTRDDVTFAGIAIKSGQDKVRGIVRDRGWTFPVAYDRDGVLSTLYNVVICPEMTFIAKGGRVVGTSFGDKSAADLKPRLDALAAGRPLPDET